MLWCLLVCWSRHFCFQCALTLPQIETKILCTQGIVTCFHAFSWMSAHIYFLERSDVVKMKMQMYHYFCKHSAHTADKTRAHDDIIKTTSRALPKNICTLLLLLLCVKICRTHVDVTKGMDSCIYYVQYICSSTVLMSCAFNHNWYGIHWGNGFVQNSFITYKCIWHARNDGQGLHPSILPYCCVLHSHVQLTLAMWMTVITITFCLTNTCLKTCEALQH